MKILTNELKYMVNKLSKYNFTRKLIPLSECIGIKEKDNKLYLTCTDATNYLQTNIYAAGEDFDITVSKDLFLKLIARLDCEYVSLEITDKYLLIKGNGEYKLDIVLDEHGKFLQFPDKFGDRIYLDEEKETIKSELVNKIIFTAKPSLAVTVERPALTAYYVGEQVYSTNRYEMTCIDNRLFSKDCLLSVNTLDLLTIFDDTDIDVYFGVEDEMIFKTENMCLYTKQQNGIEEYPKDVMQKIIKTEFNSYCVVSKQDLTKALERIELFINPLEQNALQLKFSDNVMTVTSQSQNGSEFISCAEMAGDSFECKINTQFLLKQLKAYLGESVKIKYGTKGFLCLDNDDVKQIICLMS